MPRRKIGQLSWIDGALSKRGVERRDSLGEISKLVEWGRLESLLSVIHNSARGEASYPPLMMFKVMLLQRWYGLSDPQMEEALYDRISFLRFAGLSAEDRTPDHTTIWRFRQELGEKELIQPLFAELSGQLEAHGVKIRQGTLIDASIIPSAARRPAMDEGQASPTDPDARFGTNNERGRFSFGYKGHIAVDRGSITIDEWRVTSANVQEVTIGPELLPPSGTVYADRGYDAQTLHAELAARGLGDGIMRRARRGKPLTPAEILRNHDLSLRRRVVEAVFGTLKRSYRFNRMPYFTGLRNNVAFGLACIAFNLKRWQVLATP